MEFELQEFPSTSRGRGSCAHSRGAPGTRRAILAREVGSSELQELRGREKQWSSKLGKAGTSEHTHTPRCPRKPPPGRQHAQERIRRMGPNRHGRHVHTLQCPEENACGCQSLTQESPQGIRIGRSSGVVVASWASREGQGKETVQVGAVPCWGRTGGGVCGKEGGGPHPLPRLRSPESG